MRLPAIGPFFAVTSILKSTMKRSPWGQGPLTVLGWLSWLSNHDRFFFLIASMPSICAGIFGMLCVSMLTILGEYNSSMACTFFPALQSSTRRFPICVVLDIGFSLVRDAKCYARWVRGSERIDQDLYDESRTN